MRDADYTEHLLSNGLRVAHKKVSGTRIFHCGFIINSGSRDDGAHPGVAHCLEHMLFKGTEKRRTIHVLNHLEVVGGELNAFTTKEMTAIYASLQSAHLARAIDILCDVTFHSVIPEAELAKEKKVITEEINMYLDTPEENIYDEFQEQVFGPHPLGHNILGTVESLDKIQSGDIRRFVRDNYTRENLVFVSVGNVSAGRVIAALEKYMAHTPLHSSLSAKGSQPLPAYAPLSVQKETEFSQGYVILGTPAYHETHADRWKLLLLNNLLGGPGLNSRLNLGIREKYGFAYHVESGYQAYRDTGLFHCYIGCEKKQMNRSVELIKKELRRLRENPLGSLQLGRYKRQFAGQIVMADENRSGLMIHIGKGILRKGRADSLEEILARIDKISAKDLQDTAQEIFEESKMSYLMYIPQN